MLPLSCEGIALCAEFNCWPRTKGHSLVGEHVASGIANIKANALRLAIAGGGAVLIDTLLALQRMKKVSLPQATIAVAFIVADMVV
jgi:hypothetical protein